MPQARGSNATFALFEESTYATDPGSPDGKKLYLTSFGLAKTQNRTPSNVLSSARSRTEPYLGNAEISGGLGLEIGAESIGYFLKHGLGAVATTGANPYTHAFTIANTLPTGLTLEVDYGSAISGSGRYVKYNGCRVGSMEFQFPTEGACTATVNVLGAKAVPASSALDATLTDSGHTTFSSFSAAIQEGGASIASVKTVSLTLDNGLEGDGYVIGGNGNRSQIPEGFASISGTLTALFDSAALMNKTLNDTESSLLITLSRGTGLGGAGNESIAFSLPQIKYEPTTPAVEGPGGILITTRFFAYRKSSDNGLTITVKNAIASY